MKFTQADYCSAIENLKNGLKQLEPDGQICAICADTDHQAFECHHNPLNWINTGEITNSEEPTSLFETVKELSKGG
jgi:hypothetical protein